MLTVNNNRVMRKRSGGLHCDSMEALIELSEMAQQQIGIYYDGKSNLLPRKSAIAQQDTLNSIDFKTNRHLFEGFQFNLELKRKQEEEIEASTKMHKKGRHQAIVCCSIATFLQCNKDLFPITCQNGDPTDLELSIKHSRNSIVKYWMMEKCALEGRGKMPFSKNIFETYLKCSSTIYVWKSNQEIKEFSSYQNFKADIQEQKCQLLQTFE